MIQCNTGTRLNIYSPARSVVDVRGIDPNSHPLEKKRSRRRILPPGYHHRNRNDGRCLTKVATQAMNLDLRRNNLDLDLDLVLYLEMSSFITN